MLGELAPPTPPYPHLTETTTLPLSLLLAMQSVFPLFSVFFFSFGLLPNYLVEDEVAPTIPHTFTAALQQGPDE